LCQASQHLVIIGLIPPNLLTLVAPIQRVIEVVRASVEHATVNKNGGLPGECGRRSWNRCLPSGDLLGYTDRRSEIGSHINRSFSKEAAWYCFRGLQCIAEPVFIIEEKGGRSKSGSPEILNCRCANRSRIKDLSQTFNLLSAAPFNLLMRPPMKTLFLAIVVPSSVPPETCPLEAGVCLSERLCRESGKRFANASAPLSEEEA
jgi:hypothetical protein